MPADPSAKDCWIRRVRAGLRSDRGDSSVEFAVIFPMALLLAFLVIGGGLYFHAWSVAARAAQIGVDAGRAYDASPAAGADAARSFLAQTGNSVENSEVNVEGDGDQIAVTVTGTVTLTGLTFTVRHRVQAPVEEFR
ncbi:TadE/TadG family type IV pilus assembly protein [Streptomyces sp. MW-W600-10]|uniref:TadE/TadG family type IV pilus assembly protein n=1 Tax=Streptomyces sp. MW-W600-10 TaxID=2829819 RepID=UPI001C47D464|nr:TadE/TadG family type IV pilus assembly protein [Streptomyces sp. MW-W600-10]MBV7249282.1 pilus assembly protein [Streptomyces sp. MW-W600-10]